MTDLLTIPARLVAEGVGLPAVWRDSYCGAWQNDRSRKGDLDLSDPQTAFGLALKLDAWERAADFGWPRPDQYGFAMTWAELIADEPENPVPLRDLAARTRHIGMDHAIRRALGWKVDPGTLAGLRRPRPGIWSLSCGRDAIVFGADVPYMEPPTALCRPWPTLAGITDPDEALVAIYEEVSDV
jgi:hypothetical protein